MIGVTVAGSEEFENLQENITILLQLENAVSLAAVIYNAYMCIDAIVIHVSVPRLQKCSVYHGMKMLQVRYYWLHFITVTF